MNLTQVSSPVWGFAKILIIFGLLVYVAFAFVVKRQVQLMTDTLEIQFEGPIKLMAWIHLILAIGILILAIIIL